MKTSIIIPSYGRPEVLNKCLESLNNLKKKDYNSIKPFEIIVINNNEKKEDYENTSKVCNKYKKLNIKEIKTKKVLGSVKARNKGIRKSKGDIIVFFDDDVIVKKKYFTYLMKHYDNKRTGAVGGSEIKNKQSFLHKILFKIKKTGDVTWSGDIISNFSPNIKKSMKVKHLHGSNFSIRKKIIDKIGLMDEKMKGHYRDETEYVYRVYKEGHNIMFEPRARVIHKPSSKGGNIDPSKKKEWAYWYYRNTSYFFFKHIYKNPLQLMIFLLRELFYGIMKAVIYNNQYYLTQIKKISEGRELYLETKTD